MPQPIAANKLSNASYCAGHFAARPWARVTAALSPGARCPTAVRCPAPRSLPGRPFGGTGTDGSTAWANAVDGNRVAVGSDRVTGFEQRAELRDVTRCKVVPRRAPPLKGSVRNALRRDQTPRTCPGRARAPGGAAFAPSEIARPRNPADAIDIAVPKPPTSSARSIGKKLSPVALAVSTQPFI